MVMPKRGPLGEIQWPEHEPLPLDQALTAEALAQLKEDNARLKKAGSDLAAAALRVVTDYDGLHRLMLATAGWAKALADEGGRGRKYAEGATPPAGASATGASHAGS